jgi:hypothetical protein
VILAVQACETERCYGHERCRALATTLEESQVHALIANGSDRPCSISGPHPHRQGRGQFLCERVPGRGDEPAELVLPPQIVP